MCSGRGGRGRTGSDFLETGIVQMVKGWLDTADGYALQEGRRIADDPYAGEAWFQTGAELRRLLRTLSFRGLGAGRTAGSHPVEVLIDAALELEGREPDDTVTHASRRLLDR